MCVCVHLSFRIIEPLTSRCSKFRFKPLANQIQEERLLEICKKESLKYSKEVTEKKRHLIWIISWEDVWVNISYQSLAKLHKLRDRFRGSCRILADCNGTAAPENLLIVCARAEYRGVGAGVRGRPAESHHLPPECGAPRRRQGDHRA